MVESAPKKSLYLGTFCWHPSICSPQHWLVNTFIPMCNNTEHHNSELHLVSLYLSQLALPIDIFKCDFRLHLALLSLNRAPCSGTPVLAAGSWSLLVPPKV
jgi:hypothetical protein